MGLIAVQKVVQIEQKIGWTEKYTIEHEKDMKLYHDAIYVDDKCYLIQNVFDITYRQEGNDLGFLYLHTNQGVRTFTINDSPQFFINTYKRIRD